MKKPNFEIERKFLINNVDALTLHKYTDGNIEESQIEQIYLIANECERRIRKKAKNGKTVYFYTEKLPITGLKRIENERQITEDEYLNFLSESDPALSPIRKTRYAFIYKGQFFELDVYEFSSTKAILEIELQSESAPVELPEFIQVIKEVTYDKAYKNHSLAKTQSL